MAEALDTEAIAETGRPQFTMPQEEAGVVRAAYERADAILEYGSGGSTVVAAELPGKHVVSVESDRKWVRMMRDWFAKNPPATGTEVEIVWANIGPTRNWGHPQNDTQWRRYAGYPLAVWEKEGFRDPDVVLVDGRFRLGCALAVAYNIKTPTQLLFDDYTNRKWMKKIENFLGKPRLVGRLAIFDLEPQPIPADKLSQIIRFMTRP